MGKKSTTRHVNHCSKTLSDGGVIQQGVVLEFTVETQLDLF